MPDIRRFPPPPGEGETVKKINIGSSNSGASFFRKTNLRNLRNLRIRLLLRKRDLSPCLQT